MSMLRGPFFTLLAAAFSLKISATLATNKALEINGNWAPGNLPQIDPADATKLIWISPGSLGGGTVSSVGFGTNASSIFSVVTPTTSPTISFAVQTPNKFLASDPSGGASSAPTMRSIVALDIPGLDAGKITTGVFTTALIPDLDAAKIASGIFNVARIPDLDAAKIISGTLNIARLPVGISAGTVAAGNDSRFHTQGTDAGTTSATFQIAGGVRIKNVGGDLEIRNAADTAYANLALNNLVINGTLTVPNVIAGETVTIADNDIRLNSDFVGTTPTENAGITVSRGTQTDGHFQWNETTKRWQAGLVGSEIDLTRSPELTFVAANVTAGILTVNPTNAGVKQFVNYKVYDNNNIPICPDEVATSPTALTLNFGSVTIVGTYRIVFVG